jgi:hypothetical protein
MTCGNFAAPGSCSGVERIGISRRLLPSTLDGNVTAALDFTMLGRKRQFLQSRMKTAK